MARLDLKGNVLFIICCGTGTVIDAVLLNVLANVMDKSIANIISYVVGVIVAFFLCRSFVFRAKDYLGRRLSSTLLVHGVGLIVQQIILEMLLNAGLGLNMAKMITIAENAILMYFLNIFVVFRKYKSKKSGASTDWVYFKLELSAPFFEVS